MALVSALPLTACAPLIDAVSKSPVASSPEQLPPPAPESESYEAYRTEVSQSAAALQSPQPLSQASTVQRAQSRAAPGDGRPNLAGLLLVEQPSAIASRSMLSAIGPDTPAGFVFWNQSRGDDTTLKQATRTYSLAAKQAKEAPLLFSIDYEGGGLSLTPSGRAVPGIQRFRAGFTDLAHPIWLGRSVPSHATELCQLHGTIMGRELSAAGANAPLSVGGDLALRLFRVRGISTDPSVVARCLFAAVKAAAQAGPILSVTKHFPGLGQNQGDTHDVVSRSIARTQQEVEAHLQPFRSVIADANRAGLSERLSIMNSHGLFPLLDPRLLATESPAILTELLKNRLGFQGIRMSDAMWMGDYGKLTGDALYAVYITSVMAGNDVLMIPGNRFGGALRAFHSFYSGQASASLVQAVVARTGLPPDQAVAKFQARANESLQRNLRTRRTLQHASETILEGRPSRLTARERQRYHEILRSIDPQWGLILPAI